MKDTTKKITTGEPVTERPPQIPSVPVEKEDFPIMEVNVRRIGKPARLSKADTAALIGQLPEKFKEYPPASVAYQLGEFRIMYPLPEAPIGLGACNWGVVTDADTGKPLALVPGVWPGYMENLRKFFRVFGRVPIIVMYNGTIYWDEPKYSFDVGYGWIPLTPNED